MQFIINRYWGVEQLHTKLTHEPTYKLKVEKVNEPKGIFKRMRSARRGNSPLTSTKA